MSASGSTSFRVCTTEGMLTGPTRASAINRWACLYCMGTLLTTFRAPYACTQNIRTQYTYVQGGTGRFAMSFPTVDRDSVTVYSFCMKKESSRYSFPFFTHPVQMCAQLVLQNKVCECVARALTSCRTTYECDIIASQSSRPFVPEIMLPRAFHKNGESQKVMSENHMMLIKLSVSK